MGLASALGIDWPGFITEWCLSSIPGFTFIEADEAFTTLERLWPERLAELRAQAGRGTALVAPVVHEGLVIARCESLREFGTVMTRVRRGERPAFSELRFAAALTRLGYEPELEPPLLGGKLDALITVQGKAVYAEVIAPDLSDAMQEAQRQMGSLARVLSAQNPGVCLELYFSADLTPEVTQQALSAARLLPTSSQVRDMTGIGLIRKQQLLPGTAPLGIAPPDARLPILWVAHGTNEGGVQTSANIELSLTDSRAARLMEAESDHFSRDEFNLLAMDVTRIPNGVRDFVPLVQRRMQPNLNRRFGAVVLFSEAVLGNGSIESEWRVVRNPHAYIQPPESLLTDLESLSIR